ncbi:hypothetical protein RHMOL_Rhmol07G0193100 [Rhododendron molle]|uniref:Uncharacterized protein n=1 Tax=Rhododendron molle TaxID=49168 RepID=A0ACC0N2C5_RHOML|nr:hypothetical protein RHMOL_Rhmol07G0193100 [Rhododendron molle]
MAEIGDGDGNSGGESGDRPRVDGDEIERPQIDDQPMGEVPIGISVAVSSYGDSGGGHADEVGGDGDRRTPVELGRTPVDPGPKGPRVSQMDPRSSVEDSVITGMGSIGTGGSGSSGAGEDDGSGQPPRDPASGKSPMAIEDDVPVERPTHIERVEFMPPVGSSSHEPTMSSDLVEFVGYDRLARLIREAPKVVEVVLTARKERLGEIARWNEEERLRREQEAAVKDRGEFEQETEVTERDQEEVVWAQERAVTLATSRLGKERATFTPETYAPPEAHLFVPSDHVMTCTRLEKLLLHLARPLGVIERMAVQSEALEAGQERQGQRGRSSCSRERNVYAAATGLPQLSWILPVRDSQGEAAEVHHEPARTEPAEITGPVPVEWVREAARLILAMEKAFHKIAGGTPLQLHYPPVALAPAV